LYPNDVIVINTADTVAQDGEVFAINNEGEPTVKRLIRDAGKWWLQSDNLDQRRYPRKEFGPETLIVGRVILRQSERI
jgi:phage repressor protein C with HTH and peptisase S24 domain